MMQAARRLKQTTRTSTLGVRQPAPQLRSTPSESPRAPAQNHPACAASRGPLQEQYEEITRIDAAAHARRASVPAGVGEAGESEVGQEEEGEDDDAMLRRAMAESEAMAHVHSSGPGSGSNPGFSFGSGSPPGALDEGGAATPHAASTPNPGQNPNPAWHQHRVYDDEDAELQAALRASLETVPAGFRVPSPPPIPTPPAAAVSSSQEREREQRRSREAEALVPPPIQRQTSSDVETESEAESEGPQAVQPSLEEIRRMRLARFGG